MPKMVDPAHARQSDPTTSDAAVDQLVNKSTLPKLLREIIKSWNMQKLFNDTMLTEQVNKRYGRNESRNNVARCRLRLEREGLIVRDGEHKYNGMVVSAFRRAPEGTTPLIKRPSARTNVKDIEVTDDFKFANGLRLSDFRIEIDDDEIRLVCTRTRRQMAARPNWFLDQLFKQAVLHDTHTLGGK